MFTDEMKSGSVIFRLCLLRIWGALMFALKMAMASLPNVEPVTCMVILSALCFGKDGLLSVFLYVLCEILVWGPGWWNLAYLYIWPALFGLALLFRKVRSVWFWAVLASVFGIGFGALCAIPFGLMNGLSAGIAWWQAGLPFDLLHGSANFMVTLVLFSPLKHLLDQLLDRYAWRFSKKRAVS